MRQFVQEEGGILMLKRLLDIIGAVAGLTLFSPAYIIIILGQKISSNGPIFYAQERIGKNGKAFNIIKFRTMTVNCEDDGIPQLAEENDERLTKFGKFLRSHHLDEMPQLWNVLCGDMSFVGYRPERRFFINQILMRRPDYTLLYQIRPGITSKATIYNGYTNTMEKMITRLDMDLEYLHHHSLRSEERRVGKECRSRWS